MAVAWLIWPFVLSLTALSANSITETESLLNFKKSLNNTKSLDSWTPDSEPCGESQRWVGLLCNKNSVFGLQMEQMDLSGNIDVAPLKDLPFLRTISIMNNSFSGNIPEFNQLTALKSFYISGNNFSGNIPSDYFATMASLKKAWLSNNEFSGLIPISLATKLPNLMELRLENNQFIGSIPNFTQTTLNDVDLSNNQLTGEIPPGLSKFDGKVFAGNPGLCGGTLATACPEPRNSTAMITIEGTMKDANKSKYFLAFGTLGVLLVVVLVSLAFRKKKKKRRRKKALRTSGQDSGDDQHIQVTVDESRSSSRHSNKSSRSGELTNKSTGAAELVMVNKEKGVFGLTDLMKAAAHVLNNPGGGSSRPSSSGGVGSAYKALLSNGITVVVKRVTVMNQVSVDVFDKEIRNLGSLRHKNILTPLAYHFRRDEKLLVFEFVPNLSLLHRLHGDHGEELDWPSRLKIIQGIARGMWYLHRELGSLNLPHGNLKSSNIFLAEDGEPIVSEFGLQRLINPDAQSQSLVAYKSPEAVREGTVSAKSDVFSFGVVVLEILTGKFPSQYAGLNRAGGTNLVEWIGSAMEQGGWMDLLHPTVVNAATDDQIMEEEIENVLRIGVRCTGEDPDRRPNMTEVIDELTLEDSNDDFITIET
ncbi:PREDICTED: pollen receptor-like kinase 3 [Camelina sativa]|uniref:Pollen receptor-like kinase 3 n=1 Tax=Camelina sativa TaxID=90675 RepID=A0ABM1R3L2_CAMSA|nr:PREDICTED: pollen receptor-like kinase 3 [Camelina sativa]